MSIETTIAIILFGVACIFVGFIYGMWYVREVVIDRELEEKRCRRTRMTVKISGKHCPKIINHYKVDDMYIDANLN